MGAVENAGLFDGGSIRVAMAVKEFGIGRSTLYQLMLSGRLPYSQFGRMRVIPRRALQKLLADSLVGGDLGTHG
jgi:excisionase family DNA binding protein